MNKKIDFNDVPKIIYTAPITNVRAAMNAYAIKLRSVYRKTFLISEQSIPTT